MKQQSQAAPDSPKSFDEQLQEARKCTERLINYRDRSAAELMQRLQRKGFEQTVVAHEVDSAIAIGLVDDERFTRLFIQGKKNRNWGQRRIESELRRFGIELRLCDGYPERFFTEEDELKRASECLNRFHTNAKDPWAASYRYLVSKGYEAQVAQRVLRS
ncbi:MAG: RecX family transcriptional regulator [Coriobacteriia bacterium]|nr:RecX family transcriptional regulator [Coriobacteriia bacterium]